MTKPVIRAFAEGDYQQWLPLWIANNHGHCDPAVTAETWRRLHDSVSGVHGLGAFIGDEMAGLVHYITHPVTGHIRPACYMQDLFVASGHRRSGIAKALVQALAAKARDEKYARLYWLAEGRNEAAQKLYARIGLKLDFTFHVLPLE